ncbi:MAG: hypothetical protein ACOYBC_11050, partial [Bilifractor sp.]
MMKINKWLAAVLASAAMVSTVVAPTAVMADSLTETASADSSDEEAEEGDTCVSLGADLTSDQRATVLGLLDLTESDLENDTV